MDKTDPAQTQVPQERAPAFTTETLQETSSNANEAASHSPVQLPTACCISGSDDSRSYPPLTPASCQARKDFPPQHTKATESMTEIAGASCQVAKEGDSTDPPSASNPNPVHGVVASDTSGELSGGSFSGDGVELTEISSPPVASSGCGGSTGHVLPPGRIVSATPPASPDAVGILEQPDPEGGETDANAAAPAAVVAISKVDGRNKNDTSGISATNNSPKNGSTSDGRVRVLCRFRRHLDRRGDRGSPPAASDWLDFGDGGGGGNGGNEGGEGSPPDTVSVRMGGGWSTRGFDKVFKPGVDQVEVSRKTGSFYPAVSADLSATKI